MQSLILGATGVVGGFIRRKLVGSGEKPFALSRHPQDHTCGVTWFRGDLTTPEDFRMPPSDVIYSTVHPLMLARSLNYIAKPSLKRLIFFTSTSIVTKLNSEIQSERNGLLQLADGEQRLQKECERLNISWTILRPTIIYAEGQDANLTRLATFIKRFGFLPLSGMGGGLRQPVHAEDLAIGAIAAASSPLTANKMYALPGGDTVTYQEMVGRVFDGLGKPRRIIPVPPALWRMAFTVARPFFPNANSAMGTRMSKDMVFDGSSALKDFGWNPRSFRPEFRRPL
jgi:nucleoside-diphosphate-sugar epimerase